MRRLAATLVLSALTFSSGAAQAQSPRYSEADLALAKQYFVLGKTYYDQGAYEKALEAFEESYAHSRKPALLYNIARCHESLGRIEPAIEHYEKFLAESGKKNSTIEARIRNLRARLDRKRAKAVVVPPPLAPKPPAEPKPKLAPATQPELLETKPVTAPPPRQPAKAATLRLAAQDTERPAAWMKWTGWSLIGVGAASIVTSFVFGARAGSKSSLLEDALACSTPEGRDDCPQPPGTPYEWSAAKQIEDDGKLFEALQIGTLVAGIVAGGAGAALLLLRPKERPSGSASITPILQRHAVGISGNFTF